MIYPPRDYQFNAENLSRESLRKNKRIILCMPTGSGKCLGRGTGVMMSDGYIKNVEDIIKGEKLMGPDSKERIVLSTCIGKEQLYKITLKNKDSFVCNESHILSLVCSSDTTKRFIKDKIYNLSILEYLSLPKHVRHVLKSYKSGCDFLSKKIPIDPYFLGVWLGDGDSKGITITNMDNEIEEYLYKYAKSINYTLTKGRNGDTKAFRYGFTNNNKKWYAGLLHKFRSLGLIHNKHIPNIYLRNSRTIRLKLLAGLIDTDGHLHYGGFEISTCNKWMAKDIVFLSRSLGFNANSRLNKLKNAYRISISGHTDEIPTLIKRKQAEPRQQIKNVNRYSFTVEKTKVGEYFGFEISGDKRFLLSDFTVTHNTVVFCSIAKKIIERGKRVMILADRKELIYQAEEKAKEYGLTPTIVMPKHKQRINNCYIASVDTLVRREAPEIDFLIIDEAHKRTFDKVLDNIYPNIKTIGATATPIRSFAHSLHLRYDDLIEPTNISRLIQAGYLTDCLTVSVKKDMSNVKTAINPETGEMDYSSSEMFKEFNRPELYEGVVEQYRKFANGKKALVFNCSVEHSKNMTDEFNRAGILSFHIDGMTPDWMRKQILKDFAAGKFTVLNNCSVLTTGYDEPSIECIIVNRCTMSLPLWLQMAGRGSRPYTNPRTKEKKDHFVLIDMGGNLYKHNFWEHERTYSLISEKPKTKTDSVAPIKLCPCCESGLAASATRCKWCEYEFPVAEKTLLQGEFDIIKKLKIPIKKPPINFYAMTDEQIRQYAAEKGYKPGWAEMKIRKRNGDDDAYSGNPFANSSFKY